MLQQKVKFQKVTQPEVIKNKEGQPVTTKDGKELKKAQVITSYDVQQKNDTVTKGLVADIIGVDAYVSKTQNYVSNNFQQGDECLITINVESKQTKNGGFFTSVKFVKLEHADKQQGSDDQAFNELESGKDDNLPF